MLYAIEMHKIDPDREDVYLASVQDQEAVLAGSADFHGRNILRGQVERGTFWLMDGWTDEGAMQMGLASARTLSSVAALIEQPRVVIGDGEELARRPEAEVDGPADGDPFFLVADTWVKAVCLDEYLSTVSAQAARLSQEPGFRRRLLLEAREGEHHYLVVDQWAAERAAYDSYQRRPVSQIEATGFLSLLAERGKPFLATGLQVVV